MFVSWDGCSNLGRGTASVQGFQEKGGEHAAAHMHLEFFADEMCFQGEMDLRTWKSFDAK